MHPILARPGRLGAYIAIWLPLGVLLAALLALQGVFGWIAALVVAVPLSVSYGFLCLSAWYVTGGSPVQRVGGARIGVTAVLSSFLSGAIWLLIARGWLGLIGSFGGWGRVSPPFPSAPPPFSRFAFLPYPPPHAARFLPAPFPLSPAPRPPPPAPHTPPPPPDPP